MCPPEVILSRRQAEKNPGSLALRTHRKKRGVCATRELRTLRPQNGFRVTARDHRHTSQTARWTCPDAICRDAPPAAPFKSPRHESGALPTR
jgi:hypothetical protein